MNQKMSLRSIAFFLLLAIFIVLPFVNDSRTLLILLTQIFIFGILAMSYDILLGYTGIVSFGHAMFLVLALTRQRSCSSKWITHYSSFWCPS